MTAGSQTGVYSWDGDTSIAPTLLTNAPTAVNYVFESKNIIITMGDSDTDNRLKWSDQGASTTWTATDQNQAGDDDIEGADKFISHATVRNGELVFTNGRKLLLFEYIGRPLIWRRTLIEAPDSLIAQNARVSVNGVVYWMGLNNLWEYNGGIIRPIRSNSETGHNYVRRYIFSDLNDAQQSKSFAWYNALWNEVWFHWPSSGSNECDRVVRYSLSEGHFVTDEDFNRTAAEYPFISQTYPKLCGADNVIYRHELGLNDDASTLDWSLSFPLLQVGNDLVEIGGVIPDSTQTGDISMNVSGLPYPQSANIQYAQTTGIAGVSASNFTVSPSTGRIGLGIESRDIQVNLSQSGVTDGDWILGRWNIEVAKGSERTQ